MKAEADCCSAALLRKRVGFVKLNIVAASAKPAPPISVTLGQKKINIQSFCKRFNEITANLEQKLPLSVKLYLYSDGEYDLVVREPAVAQLVKHIAGITKGACLPGKQTVATLSRADAVSIAALKLKDTQA